MNIILLGAPGAGKGTQATRISDSYKLPHISTGDIFRENIKNQTEIGLLAKSYIDKGQLVPDEVTCKIVEGRITKDDCKDGYMLDGFPRTVDQAEALEAIAAPDAVIDIEVPDEMLLERLTGRRVCPKCNGTFHITKLADEKVCPVCGDELYQRDDDKPATISNRLNVYHEQTAPLIGYYAGLGRLKRIDGNARPEDVFQKILASLE
jgi:adenylate kinase